MVARLGCLMLATMTLAATACRLEPVVLVGRACPCPAELVCDVSTSRCVVRDALDGAAATSDGADVGDAALRSDLASLPAPIGHWMLDETGGLIAKDVGVIPHDAVIVGGTPTWSADPQRGRVLSLPSSASLRVAALDGANFPSTGSLVFYFRGDVALHVPVVWSIFDAFDSARDHFFVRVAADDTIQIAGNKVGSGYVVTASQAATRDVWHRVAMTWQTGSGAAFTVQTDDSLFEAPLDEAWTPAQQSFVFGGAFPELLIDNIALYGRRLTANEIAMLPPP